MKRILILAALLFPAGAVAQEKPCGEREQVLAFFAEKGARIMMRAEAHNGITIEHFVLEDGMWFATGTNAGGMTCILANGTGFEALDEEVKVGVPG